MNFEKKIESLRMHFDTNNAGLEKLFGLSNGYISNVENNEVDNPGKLLTALSARGISADWFLSENGSIIPEFISNNEKLTSQPNSGKTFQEKADKSASSLLPDTPAGSSMVEKPQKEALVVVDGGVEQGVLIPVIDQGVSTGFGFDYEEGEIIRYIKVPAWLSRSGRNLVAVPVYGESMEPTLSRGNLAICDLGGFKDDGVYVLRDEERGLLFCKRVIWTPGGWTIVSDNPRYEPMKVEDKSIEVIARVIAAVKEVK